MKTIYRKRKEKLSNCKLELMSKTKPNYEYFVDAKFRYKLNSIEEYKALCKKIKSDVNKYHQTQPNMHLDSPIIILNELSKEAIRVTKFSGKSNIIVLSITFFVIEPIMEVIELNYPSIEKLIEEISR